MNIESMKSQAFENAMNNIAIIDTSPLTSDNVVICKVDGGDLPVHRAKEVYAEVRDALTETFSPAKVIVMSSKSDITII
jgi:hypothetical protein